LSQRVGIDLSGLDVDGPFPEMFSDKAISSRAVLLSEMARRDGLTIRQLYTRIAGGRGHFDVSGSPQHVADIMEAWFKSGAADGFNIMPPVMPGGLDDFVELVIPELQKRGLYRTCYEGRTLRDHLGLKRPRSRYDRMTRSSI
jgi:alkanesulfonate monooxygenase SsuD/methylene tetrahydromethanopterin reductase-like flavin-dependent oxidoreductase (luciferase family)